MSAMKHQATIQVALDKITDAAFVIGYNRAEGQFSQQLVDAVREAHQLGVSPIIARMTYMEGVQRGKTARETQSQIRRLQNFLDHINEED